MEPIFPELRYKEVYESLAVYDDLSSCDPCEWSATWKRTMGKNNTCITCYLNQMTAWLANVELQLKSMVPELRHTHTYWNLLMIIDGEVIVWPLTKSPPLSDSDHAVKNTIGSSQSGKGYAEEQDISQGNFSIARQ